MKLYLSSYKLGDHSLELKELLAPINKKAFYISNALDFSSDLERRQKSEAGDYQELLALGLEVEKIDLRDYFGKTNELEKMFSEGGLIFVRGGNVFVLRQAMKLSGFDEVIKKLLVRDDLIYAAYSAGACILAPTLSGLELIDDKNVFPYPDCEESITSGLGIINYSFIPHYDSSHDESKKADEVIKFMIDNKILFKALKDGEVIII